MEFDITACMIFRDEAPILAEWLEYHSMLGVEHFFLYSHMSEDNYKEVLRPYIKREQVTLEEWNFPRQARVACPTGTSGQRGPYPQVTAYDDAVKKARDRANWMLVIDSDEFLAQLSDLTLSDFLQRHEGVAGVLLNWATFGTNGHKTAPPGLVIENYLARDIKAQCDHRHVKSIINPAHIVFSWDPHQWQVEWKDGVPYKLVDEHGVEVRHETQVAPFLNLAGTPSTSWDFFRINHYVTRSEEECRWKLLQRGRLSDGVWAEDDKFREHFRHHNANIVRDEGMLKHVAEVKRRLAAHSDLITITEDE